MYRQRGHPDPGCGLRGLSRRAHSNGSLVSVSIGSSQQPVVVYTAVYGGYDVPPRPVDQDVPVEWVCFTDDASLSADGWRMVHEPSRFDHPRMSAKWYKALPDLALPEVRWSIWIDANARVDSISFASSAVALADRGLAVFRHPQRDCIYLEARASRLTAPSKYAGQPMEEQVAHYRQEGHPTHGGLYAGGTIVRDSSRSDIREVGRRWLDECVRWTYQDQLSLPVVLRRLGVTPSVFPFHLHRHGVIDSALCRMHRWWWFEKTAALARERVARSDVGPIPPPAGRSRRRFASNPWWELVPHRGSD